VIELLVNEMKAHDNVLPEPEPFALFVGFGDSSLNFSARCWCRYMDSLATSSQLHVAFNRALAEADIEIPFPQRDLHLRSIDPDVRLTRAQDPASSSELQETPRTGEPPDDD
jgi:potassium efflux system protein